MDLIKDYVKIIIVVIIAGVILNMISSGSVKEVLSMPIAWFFIVVGIIIFPHVEGGGRKNKDGSADKRFKSNKFYK